MLRRHVVGIRDRDRERAEMRKSEKIINSKAIRRRCNSAHAEVARGMMKFTTLHCYPDKMATTIAIDIWH